MTTATQLLRTPFHSFHLQHKAKMVDFAGWEMPLSYGSIIEEHRHCRASAGFFDVSHMGRLRFTGRHARRVLDTVCTRQVLGMEPGQCRYGIVCNERGGCLDDIIVYCMDESDFLVVCNASNRAKLLAHFAAVKGDMVFKLDDQTESTAMCALQGPKAMDLIAGMSREIPNLKRYRFTQKNLIVVKLIVSRTGYTGEDGVETRPGVYGPVEQCCLAISVRQVFNSDRGRVNASFFQSLKQEEVGVGALLGGNRLTLKVSDAGDCGIGTHRKGCPVWLSENLDGLDRRAVGTRQKSS